MNEILERLQTLKVEDVMNQGVISVRAWQPMEEVAVLYHDREITSAPVVNEQGKCVGILSAADFLLRDASCADQNAPGAKRSACQIIPGTDREPLNISHPSDDTVGNWMTDEVLSISPSSTLEEAAKKMCDQHVHRLVVLDETRNVSGIVSTMDIVAAVVNALDETQLAQGHSID